MNINNIPKEISGLLLKNKNIPDFYGYDKKGSEIYSKITESPEYYISKKDYEILNKFSKDILKKIDVKESLNIIELGSGDGNKTKILIDKLIENNIKVNYIPIDISQGAINQLISNYKDYKNTINIRPIINDYINGLKHFFDIEDEKIQTNLIIFLGTTISNYIKSDAIDLLKDINKLINKNDLLLLSIDLKKPIDLIYKAYNISLMYDFTYNYLKRLNNDFGANFNISRFDRYVIYNPNNSAIENWIICKKNRFNN